MLIAQANLSTIVDNFNSYPQLKPLIGDRPAWGEIPSSLNINCGGQKRRLGRFLFAVNARRFRDGVGQIVQDMQQRGARSTDVAVHIFCGLAGRTGWGTSRGKAVPRLAREALHQDLGLSLERPTLVPRSRETARGR